MGARRIVAALAVLGAGVLGMGSVAARPLLQGGRWEGTMYSLYASRHYHYCFRNMRSAVTLAGPQHAHCRLAQPPDVVGRRLTLHLTCRLGTGPDQYRSQVRAREHINATGTALWGTVTEQVHKDTYTQVMHERIRAHRVGICSH